MTRLFVGNIPLGVEESDLRQEFSAYGNVHNVELKTKPNLVDPDNPNVFGFITLDAKRNVIEQCIQEFKNEQYRGRYLTVSVAKESFLDRLKREREEAQSKDTQNKTDLKTETSFTTTPTVKKSEILPKVVKKTSSSSSSDSDESSDDSKSELETLKVKQQVNQQINHKQDNVHKFLEDDEQEDNQDFIQKKRAIASLQNGKIKINDVTNTPIHVIMKKSKNTKELDEKAKISDLKRKESLSKMKNQYNQQKMLIQKSLSSVDMNKKKKIIFEDEDSNENNSNELINNNNKKTKIFESDNESDEDEKTYEKSFEIKKQYEGKGGEKLLKLQSKFKTDPRFQMNEKFLEENNDDDDDDENMDTNRVEERSNEDNDLEEEKRWQLSILEKVVGQKLELKSEQQQNKKHHKTMLRYDPTKEEHEKFVKNKKNTFNKNIETNDQKPAIEVSQEKFYKVDENLTKSLKLRGDGFSLLSLFGQSNEEEMKNSENNKNEVTSTFLIKPEINLDNPFKFDSSDSEAEEPIDKLSESTKVEENTNKMISNGKVTKAGVWNENFFIFNGDQRLKDGLAFFKSCQNKQTNDSNEDYETVRDNLRKIIKGKIHKSRKNIIKDKKKQKGKFKIKK